jgi:aspartate carbamoyltransferase regulatory subunit
MVTETEKECSKNYLEINQKLLAVSMIEEGTVLDHISSGKGIFLVRLLKLESYPKKVTIGLNLPSRLLHRKDLIKVEGRKFTKSETSQIAVFSPQTTISIIQNFQVIEKYSVELPNTIEHHSILCPNIHCITNNENIYRIFDVLPFKKTIQLRCRYCEKNFYQQDCPNFT